MNYINDVLDDIIIIHSLLKKGFRKAALEAFEMFEEDVKRLSKSDYNAACILLWRTRSIDAGSDIYGYIWTTNGFMTIDEFYGH